MISEAYGGIIIGAILALSTSVIVFFLEDRRSNKRWAIELEEKRRKEIIELEEKRRKENKEELQFLYSPLLLFIIDICFQLRSFTVIFDKMQIEEREIFNKEDLANTREFRERINSEDLKKLIENKLYTCLLYTSPSPRD